MITLNEIQFFAIAWPLWAIMIGLYVLLYRVDRGRD